MTHAQVAPAAGAFPIVDCVGCVLSNDAVSMDYRRLIVAAERPATLAQPGQFFQILCPVSAVDAPYLRRPMSIYRVDQEAGYVEFLYKVTGAGTRALAVLERGAALSLLGPLGKGSTSTTRGNTSSSWAAVWDSRRLRRSWRWRPRAELKLPRS
jgi:NAD(P)H-flavin reductase